MTGAGTGERRFRQLIPRPPWARPGKDAPWSAGAAPLPLAAVRAALASRLLPAETPPEVAVAAAVLIPLFESDGDAIALLIRRATRLSANPGEIAFPGGRLEPGERPLAAALRESQEELGLPPSLVEVIGRLPVRERTRHPGAIAPFVGTLAQLPALEPCADEVDEVLFVPVRALMDDGVYWEELWNPEGSPPFVMPFFADPVALGDDLVWGATARMLADLLSLIATPGD